MENLLHITNIQAREYFLSQESYCSIELPQYFQFGEILSVLSNEYSKKGILGISCFFNQDKNFRPEKLEGVNYELFHKKGKYSWRNLQIMNPLVYISLVFEITKEKNWSIIKERFDIFQANSKIYCAGIPVFLHDGKNRKSGQIKNWIENVERQSIILGLEYSYMFQTDIADCYPSIYTHSIPWALHGKDFAKQSRDSKSLIGNIIDSHIQMMQYGQTNGIPQGSSLMDFIAEMVLGYADYLLTEKLIENADYKIIRYRDDYRIFVNDMQLGEEILKNLTEVLIGLGMKLKSEKTSDSNNIIQSSIKPDKLFELVTVRSSKVISKELYIIHSLAERFPNSGVIIKRLQRLSKLVTKKKVFNEDPSVIISILVTIALRNPRTYPIIIAILSKIISSIEDNIKKEDIFKKIQRKFSTLPNTEHLDVWLQRITIKLFPIYNYSTTLAKVVSGEEICIWNCDGFNENIQKLIKKTPIVNREILDSLDSIISLEEIEVFRSINYQYNL